MSIHNLPDETLLHIFKLFANIPEYDDPFMRAYVPCAKSSENTKCLASFSKVCSRWHSIIEPVLYSTFTKPNNGCTRNLEWDFLRNCLRVRRDITYVSEPNRSLRLFLRTIIERPHLAKSITRLVIGSWDETISSEQCKHPGLGIVASQPDPALRQAYQKALGRLEELADSLTRRRARISSTRGYSGSESCILGGDEGSELALLLLLTPNLDTLHLAQMPIMEDWMSVRLPGVVPAVSHVRKIRLGSVGKVLDFAEDRLRWLMTLPSLKALTVFNCRVYGSGRRRSVPRPSQLTSLEFRSCWSYSEDFESFTRHLSMIESFEWTGKHQSRGHILTDREVGDLGQKILNLLDRQKSTLRSVRLSNEQRLLAGVGWFSFEGFNSPEELHVHCCFFEGYNVPLADRLPRSLRQLRLYGTHFPVTGKLVSLISSRALPKLGKVDYGPVALPAHWQEPTSLQDLEDVCVKKGVMLRNVVSGGNC